MDEIYKNAKSWPFVEARKIIDRAKGYALFETGYGPSGLPHIGTFGEVARTTYVKHAFETLTGLPAKLFAFSDDLDGLRKVPDNIPNQDMVAKYLGFPLTEVPDPFGCHRSFGEHNNAKLQEFLDSFGFDYEFKSATFMYKSGAFNEILLRVLTFHKEILDVMLKSLREERASTYSPFLPISPKTGRVLQVPIEHYNVADGTVVFKDEDGEIVEHPVTDGNCKLQWKVDWAARWTALGVDYEMAGKDLIDSVKLSSQICKILGGTPPCGFNYELFLDEEGKKISKSKGNGLSVEEWLRYAPQESLSNFMYSSPKSAKRLCFDVIPRNVDDYLTNLKNFPTQEPQKQVDNPCWHIHASKPPKTESDITYSLILNLASACNPENKDILWGFIKKYLNGASPDCMPFLDKLITHAINYYEDFIKMHKTYPELSENERSALEEFLARLSEANENASADDFQFIAFECGKKFFEKDLKSWFSLLYRALFGQAEGPRIGTFTALYGLSNMKKLIKEALDR